MTETFNSGKNGIFNLAHVTRVYWSHQHSRFMIQVGNQGFEIDEDKEKLIPRKLRPDAWPRD